MTGQIRFITNFFALIPETEGYDLEIREYWTDKTVYEQRSPKGQILASEKEDPRCDVLSDLIFDILPEDGDEIIESVSYYTDGIGGSAGYVEYGNENADGTSMSGIDVEGGQENSRFLLEDVCGFGGCSGTGQETGGTGRKPYGCLPACTGKFWSSLRF